MEKTIHKQINETIYRETLSNGLEVMLVPKPELEQTYGVFTTNYGSIDNQFVPLGEKDMIKVPDGIAHFLEHKLFEKEDHDVFQEFTALGSSANAFTSFTKTAYLFSATSNIKKNTEILLDFVQDPYFSKASVEKEKGIISQEIQMYDDQADWRAFFGIIEAMYQNHPVKIDIAGTVESIQHITEEDLYTCYHTFYHPSNMTFCLVGAFDAEEMLAVIRENQANKSFEPAEDIKRDILIEPTHVDLVHHELKMPVVTEKCMIGIKETPTSNPTQFIKEELISEMILDYFYSKSGAYYQELYDLDLIDGSLGFETERQLSFAFSLIGANSTDVEMFKNVVLRQLDTFRTYSFSDIEFKRMKRKMIGGLMREMNSTSNIANSVSQYHMLGIDYFTLLPTLEAITKEDVESFMHQWIKSDNVASFFIKKATSDE
ncbi:peptidase M16 [Halolactibacillus alkaliphilus]|uniref:Peptidase M16 n=1 Tax=Halolactibacillus alkaliphilus TaxID=442899 RepID=A0A511X4G4_9BACI|nr:pitrilysin family protein [Halolactibacillus alkaliphilus]GEN57805.1 peptidase M16 [Halolactibacillus alkaliphilus]GGN75151.1 peptidase M16 [Halolactibacillus alkaliphilus]SFP05134.1 Predicted Zn-dependent peptidase [Halolactibacillus alkaliphilus]